MQFIVSYISFSSDNDSLSQWGDVIIGEEMDVYILLLARDGKIEIQA